MDPLPQVGWLHRVSSARHQGDPGNSIPARRIRDDRGRVGTAHQIRAGRRQHGRGSQPHGARGRARDVRGLDRPYRRGRSAACAAPAVGRGAQRRDLPMGLGGPEGLSARSDIHRQARPLCQCVRADLRGARGQRGLSARPRPRASRQQRSAGARTRPRHAGRFGTPDDVVAVLGRRSDLGQPRERAQPDARSPGARLDHLEGSRLRESCVLPGGLRPSVRAALPHHTYGPQPRHVRSGHGRIFAHQHMLQHTSPDVRGRRRQHALDERRWSGHRLAEHQDVRRNWRRRSVAGLVSAHPRYQRQRQAGRVGGAQRAHRPQQGQAHLIGLLRRILQPGRWLDLGHIVGIPGRRHPLRPGDQSHRVLPTAMGQPGRSGAGLLAAGWRHRSQRCLLERFGERAHGELRSHQVPRTSQRTEGYGGPLPRRMDAVSGAPAATERCDRLWQRRVQLLHVG